MSNLFIEILQIALCNRKEFSYVPSNKEWAELFSFSSQQAIIGISLTAIDRLDNKANRPPLPLLLEWIGIGEQIKVQNKLLNRRCGEVTKLFADAGFKSCILKGQGNALMYPSPELRMPGDIDIWVKGSREAIENFIKLKCATTIDSGMHIEFPVFQDVTVEVHYKPRYSTVPKYEKRLQKWFEDQSEEQFSNVITLDGSKICVPTARFNAVQQMSHMMGHFFSEGIGFRHLIDYYYLLKTIQKEGIKENFVSLFDYLGMLSFSSGIMWIEKTILGLDEMCLIVPPSERKGKIILDGVIDGGNFGHFRLDNVQRRRGVLNRFFIDTYRLLKIATLQPSESVYRFIGKIGNTKSLKKVFWGV